MWPFATDLSLRLVNAFIEWRAGPETAQSQVMKAEIESKQRAIESLKREVEKLEQQRFLLRRSARKSRPTWWNRNKAAIAVNVVASLIAAIPVFILGVLVTLWIQK